MSLNNCISRGAKRASSFPVLLRTFSHLIFLRFLFEPFIAMFKIFSRSQRRKKEQKNLIHDCSVFHSIELGIPPPPLEIIQKRPDPAFVERIKAYILKSSEVTPLASVYRMYVHIMLDDGLFQKEVLHFMAKRWQAKSIPDPHDRDTERLAMLSCTVALLVDRMRERGISDDLPGWATDVPPLPQPLVIPFKNKERGKQETLSKIDDPRASAIFGRKNILVKSSVLVAV